MFIDSTSARDVSTGGANSSDLDYIAANTCCAGQQPILSHRS
jgi:hypothetical protein